MTKSQIPLFSEEKIFSVTELEAAKQSAMNCLKCPLSEKRTNVVFGEGRTDKPLVFFLGEAPGDQEDRTGRPFVGRAGVLLDTLIEGMMLSRHETYTANTVCCRPPANRKPNLSEVAACAEYLVKQIRIVRPVTLVALGGVAAETLIGGPRPINELRGRWFHWKDIPLRVTYHPAYILRNPEAKAYIQEDLKAVSSKLYELGALYGKKTT
jgi:DNA polymerase